MHSAMVTAMLIIIAVSVISSHVIRRDSVYRREYLKTFGYGNETKYPQILGKFQDYAHLNLAEVMDLPRCAFKDQKYSPLQNISEDQDFLLFAILQYPRNSFLSNSEIDTIAREVAASWEYSGLQIKSSRREDADIVIRFCDFSECFVQERVDLFDQDKMELFDLTGVTKNKFGGGWEILINSNQAWAGETNLERISYGASLELQMQLKQVLLHQFGHALGLPHSANPVSIMSPFYYEWIAGVEPSHEDFTSVSKLLGRKPRIPRTGRHVKRPDWIHY